MVKNSGTVDDISRVSWMEILSTCCREPDRHSCPSVLCSKIIRISKFQVPTHAMQWCWYFLLIMNPFVVLFGKLKDRQREAFITHYLRNHRWCGNVYVLKMFFCFFSVHQKYETTVLAVLGNGWTDFHETFTKRCREKWSLKRHAAVGQLITTTIRNKYTLHIITCKRELTRVDLTRRWRALSPIHITPMRCNGRVESRRRCEHNSQLAHDDCRRIRSTIWKLNRAVWLREFWSILITFSTIRPTSLCSHL